MSVTRATRDAVLTRLMGGSFAIGATCFLIGPTQPYTGLVGNRTDALTLFVGSILFTLGGLTQWSLAAPERCDATNGRAAWRTAWTQSIGTVLFNVMTLEAIRIAVNSIRYDELIWTPNALGSVCFLVSGTIFYLSSPRRGWRPQRRHHGWWEPAVNLLGCVLFGISAVAGYSTGGRGVLVSVSLANWTTTAGAACFLSCGLMACVAGHTLRAPRLRALRGVEREIVADVEREAHALLD